ncbi:MAG: hypothetical protein JWM68_5829 [Verrucomicrobiales bacterium]|nr:hypothetical protein [Verrucomicrobiales bacterium]
MTCKSLVACAVAFFVFLSTVHSDPINIVVEDLTFNRPVTWKWDPPNPQSPAISRFIVPNGESKYVANVRFYNAVRDSQGAADLWRGYFSKEDASSLRKEMKTIGKCKIAYIYLQGTLTLPAEKPTAGQGFVGVVIPCGDKFLHIHCFGQRELVEKAIPDLKNMVDTAVRERESDLENK